MRTLLVVVFYILFIASPHAQSIAVHQGGNITAGDVAVWAAPGVVVDGGSATNNNYVRQLGLAALGGTPLCINTSTLPTAIYNSLCFGIDLTTGAYIYDNQVGGSGVPFVIDVNGNKAIVISTSGVSTFLSPPIIPQTGFLYGNNTTATTTYTASGILDVIGNTRGSILYRGASGWALLAPGTSGQALETSGAGADPVWATVLGTGTVTSVGGDGVLIKSTPAITVSGTLTLANQNANCIVSGPASGSATTPTCRAAVATDIATGSCSTITAAATTDLGSVTCNNVIVTGNTGITSFGSTATAGTEKFVTFTGTPQLAYSTSLVLPGAGNLQIAAGDVASFVVSTAGNWFLKSYTPAASINLSLTNYVVDSGSANTIVIAPINQVTTYTAGMKFTIKIAANNTGATTLNASALGTKNVYSAATGVALAGGELKAGSIYSFVYDGTQFQLLAASANVYEKTITDSYSNTSVCAAKVYYELHGGGGGAYYGGGGGSTDFGLAGTPIVANGGAGSGTTGTGTAGSIVTGSIAMASGVAIDVHVGGGGGAHTGGGGSGWYGGGGGGTSGAGQGGTTSGGAAGTGGGGTSGSQYTGGVGATGSMTAASAGTGGATSTGASGAGGGYGSAGGASDGSGTGEDGYSSQGGGSGAGGFVGKRVDEGGQGGIAILWYTASSQCIP